MADIKHFDPDVALETVVHLFWRQGMASTGIRDIVSATGLNRSSLYSTFGSKQDLYRAALCRYIDKWSEPVFSGLTEDGRGLPVIAEFFTGLIDLRCSGRYAQWGCMVTNAHAGMENDDPEIRSILDRHHEKLRNMLRAALVAAHARDQLDPAVDPDAAADVLVMLVYAINLRSRAGAEAGTLRSTVTAALISIGCTPPDVGTRGGVTSSTD
ncbi:TetR/AcrR family transcriptional regulator [Nocardia sp. 004]|uniref:TetR/AcrR family transcriptional regulator n=1 Tax=Nocardia sp. 004 TaxID=3385978 RepID=UPI0039A1E738